MAKKTADTSTKPVTKDGTNAEPKVDPTPVNPPPDQPIQVVNLAGSRA